MSVDNRIEKTKKIRLTYGEDQWQYGELRIPDGPGPHPVVVVIHGGFWKSIFGADLMDAVAEDLTKCGLATWNIEYRRVGNIGGAYPGTLNDVANATDFLVTIAEEYSLDLKKVVAMGHSAGGQLAFWLAGRNHLHEDSILKTSSDPLLLKGVVSLGGIIDLELMNNLINYKQQMVKNMKIDNPVTDFVGGTPNEVPERYAEVSPVQLLPLNIPQILIHGDLDVNVPVKLSALYKELAEKAGDQVKMITFPNVEHFEIIDPDSKVWDSIVNEVRNLLKD
ncbi:alpha/beta hydrolase [Bacillus sp. AFS055030]|uniref:alpha/beta hydrolase family protein n=1 Tax=Bacillus sp. AFS055030 TaxID=2033507 RepID=UPI000BFD01CE|nr:alpha/beta hydrolase [Bacillus sp. AFS055030]PGL70239.1 alpha/beta hydrolase [Bacillus sp. AFS055030]